MTTVEEAMRHLGEPVTGALRDFAEAMSRGFLWKSGLEGRVRTYTCSLCGATWEYDDREPVDIYQEDCFQGNLPHWERVSCPNCERSLDVYETWRGLGKVGYKEHFVEQWRKSAVDPDVMVAVGAQVMRVYPEPGMVIHDARVRVISFIVYRYGRAGERYVQDGDQGFRRMTRVNHLDVNIKCPDRHLDESSVTDAIRGTAFERVWTDGLLRASPNGDWLSSPACRMSWLSTHPTAEYMLKLGFEKLVIERFRTPYSADQVINWRGRSMEEVFKMDRATVKALRPYSRRLGLEELGTFRMLREAGIRWPADRLIEAVFTIGGARYSAGKFIEAAERRGYQLKNELKYLLRQMRRHRHIKMYDLEDYWRQCDRLEVAADDYATRHPANLEDSHAEFTARIQYQADSGLDEAIAERYKAYERDFCFAACGLTMRPAMSTKEIIREGSSLHHCVGGYCTSYAQGRTVILVLRREEQPDEPYHTVEMSPDGRLIQCRGDHNRTADEDKPLIDAFWSAYRSAKAGDAA